MKRATTLVLLLSILLGAEVLAQGRSLELGVDFGLLSIGFSGGETLFNFESAGPRVRLGVPVSDKVVIEPSLAADVFSGAGVTLATFEFGVAVPYYWNSQRRGFFIRPATGLTFISADISGAGASDAQFFVGLGLGGKSPVGSQLALRYELFTAYSFETDIFHNAFTLQGLFGISVFFN